MHIYQIDPAHRREVRKFIDLPYRLYASAPQWVPPLSIDEPRRFKREVHPFYEYGEAAFFLAEGSSGRPVGRLAVLDNHRFRECKGEQAAFFYLFEAEEDLEIAERLFEAAFAWARSRGLETMIGPKGFGVLDGHGLLVEGFEHRPAFGQPYNLPYYPEMLDALGFERRHDMVSGYMDAHSDFPDTIHQLADRLRERRGLHIARFTNRRELQGMTGYLKDLYNNALAERDLNTPLTDADAAALLKQLIWFADPALLKIVMKEAEPVGFLFAYPDVSIAVQRIRGKVLPFGWIALLRELRRTQWININGAGMKEGYRGLGGTALLFSEMYKSAAQGQYRFADIVQINVENDRMLREMQRIGIQFYKTHRIFEKKI